MKVLKKGCVRRLAVKQNPFYKRLLVAQDPWLPKDAWKRVKAKKAGFGTPHLPTTGTEVARMRQVWSQVMAAVMEIK